MSHGFFGSFIVLSKVILSLFIVLSIVGEDNVLTELPTGTNSFDGSGNKLSVVFIEFDESVSVLVLTNGVSVFPIL
jgi:hypothetical protein